MPSLQQDYLPTLSVPLVEIPTLGVPKLHAAPKAAPKPTIKTPAQGATTKHGTRKLVKRRVPVHTDTYQQSAAATSAPKKKAPADPFAKVPIVQDTVGAPPIMADTTPPATTPAAPAATPAPSTTDTGDAASDAASVVPVTPTPDTDLPDGVTPAEVSAVSQMSIAEQYDLLNPPASTFETYDYEADPAAADPAPAPPAPDPNVVVVPSQDPPPPVAPPVVPPVVQPPVVPPPVAAPDIQTPDVQPPATPPPSITAPTLPGSLVTPSAGGSADSADGQATVTFGPGTVVADVGVSVGTASGSPPLSLQASSAVYDLTAVDGSGSTVSAFGGMPTLTIRWDPARAPPTAIYYLPSSGAPVALPSTIDYVNHTISAALPHFSAYVAASPAVVAMTITPSVVAAGSAGSAIQVTVTQGGQPVGPAVVDFTGAGLTFSAPSCTTDATTGLCSVTVTSAAAGVFNVTAKLHDNPATATTPVTFQTAITQTLAGGADHTITLDLTAGTFKITVDTVVVATQLAATVSTVTLTGGNQTNTLIGANIDSLWTLTGANAGTITGTGLPPITFTLIQNVTGGTAKDTFVVAGGTVTGTIDGGAGVDTLEAVAAGSVWTLTAATVGTLNAKPFTGIENVTLAFPDTADAVRVTQQATGGLRVESALVGGFAAATIAITGGAAPGVIVDTRGGDDTVVVDSITTLVPALTIQGGAGNDAVVAVIPAALGAKLTVDGGAGVDRFEDYTGATVATGGAVTVSNVELIPAGLPSYVEEGPGAITETTPLTADKFPAAAAVNAIAIQPGNALVMFLASVNGGVWRTIDGGTTWTPLTDQLPSLSIGSIAIAAKDVDGNAVIAGTALNKLVVFAGTGSFSSFQGRGGFPVGLFKSLDGGTTWSVMASDQLSGIKISAIVASDKDNVVVTGYGGAASTTTAIAYNKLAADVKTALEALPNIGAGNVDVSGGALPGSVLTITFKGALANRDVPNLMAFSSLTGGTTPAITITTVDGKAGVSSEVQTLTITGTPTGGSFTLKFGDVLGGVFRSTNGGTTFIRVVAGAATDLVADPAKAGRLYAGVAESGVYRSDDAGVSWKRFDTGLTLTGDQIDNDGNGILNDVGETGAGALRIRLAVQQNAAATDLAPNAVYVALIGGAFMGVFSSTPTATGATAASWTQSAWALVGPADAIAATPISASLNKAFGLNIAGVPQETDVVISGCTIGCVISDATITRTRGDWRADGFAVGQVITITGALKDQNNGSFKIKALTDKVMTLTAAGMKDETSKVSVGAQNTADIAWNSTTAQVKAALEALGYIGAGNVTVTATPAAGTLPGTDFTITFKGILGKRDVPTLGVAANNLTGGATPAVTIVTTTEGVNGSTDEVQRLRITGTPTGGSFKLSFDRGVAITASVATAPTDPASAATLLPSNPKTQPQVNLGGQGNLHFGFAVDGKGNVFISGDIGLSTAGYPANLFLYNALAGTWSQLVDQTATSGIVRPHADIRALILDPAGAPGTDGANVGKLLLAGDGGVWRLDLAATPTRTFTSLNGGGPNGTGALRISEVLSLAYDELNALVFGGAQDNGSYEQFAMASDRLDATTNGQTANGLTDDLGERITWRSTSGGDGNTGLAIPIDTDGDGLYDRVLHIVGSNNLNWFTESLYSANGTRVSFGWPATFGSAGPAINVTGLLPSGRYSGPTASLVNNAVYLLAGSNTPYYLELFGDVGGVSQFILHQFSPTGPQQLATVAGATTINRVTPLGGVSAYDRSFTGFRYIPMAVNAVNPNMVVVGMSAVYESTNYLATISSTPITGGYWTALAYGGKIAGANDATVLYAATGNSVWVRYTGHALAAEPLAGATSVRSLVVDPRDSSIAYAATDVGIFRRDGVAGTWSLISQNLFNANFQTVEFVPGTGGAADVLLVGTAVGIYRAFIPAVLPATGVAWTLFGRNLPNALVTGILDVAPDSATHYSGANPLASNQLVVSTQGRGTWTIQGLSASISVEPVLTINGTDADDTVVISRNSVNASILDVTMNGAKVFSTPILSLKRIAFNGNGGNDSLTVDSTYGAISLADGVVFTSGAGADSLVLTGGRYDTTTFTSDGIAFDSTDTYDVTLSRGGGREKVVFFDYDLLLDTHTNNITASSAAEKLADGVALLALSTSVPSSQLAILGSTLPRVINGAAPSTPTTPGISDPVVAAPPGGETEADAGLPESGVVGEGLSRLFEFEGGGSLFGRIQDGEIVTVDDLMAALTELAGVGNVINHGDSVTPRIELHLTKTIEGHGSLDMEFDQFGGHAEFEGELDVSVDVHLNVIFGVDASGNFYLETNGAGPEVVFDNIQVDGALEGEGRLGFLGVTLENGTVSVSNVSISIDLAAAGDKLDFASLTPEGIAAASTVTATGGPVSVTADLGVQALLPGMDEPFDLGGATIAVTWADISQPENAVVNLSGGVSELLKARVEELTALLEKMRALTEELDGTIPPEIQQGLDKVISVVKSFDENVVQALSQSSTEITLQDIVNLMADALHIDLDSFHLAYSGGVLSWELDLSDLGLGDLSVSSSSFAATLSHLKFTFGIDFGKVIAVAGGSGEFSIADALSITVQGDIDGLNILDALQGGLQFELGRQLVNVDLNNDSAVDLHGAQLLSFGLNLDEAQPTDPETRFLRIGASDYALTIQDGSIAVALLSAPTPTTVGAIDTRRWVAVEAHGLSGSLVLGTFASASASGIDVFLNSASGAFDPNGSGTTLTLATPLNWTTAIDFQTGAATFGADPVVILGTTLDLVSNVAVRIAGSLTGIDIGGFVHGAADFEITKSTIDVHPVSTPDVIGATLLTFGLDNLSLSVGEPGGVGFDVSGGSLAIATIAPPAPSGVTTDTRRWFAMKGSVGSATFNGITGLTLADITLRLEINRASGAYDADGSGSGAAVDAGALNWTGGLDLDRNTAFGEAADQLTVGSGHLIDFTTGVVRAAGSARINVFDFVSGRIGFSFSQQLVDVDVNADGIFNPAPLPSGTDIRGPPSFPDLNDASLTTLSLSVLADDGDSSNGSEGLTIGVPGGVGLFVSSGDLAVAIVTPSTASTGDARSWLALSAHIASASLNGITGLVLGASGLTLEINRGSGVFDPTPLAASSGDEVAATALDWTAAIDLDPEAATFANDAVNVPVETSTGTVDTLIDFTGPRLHVAGVLSLNLASGTFVLSGGFDLTSATLTSTAGGPALVDADLLALTITNAAIFVGTGGTLTVGADPLDRSLDVVGYGAGAQGFYGAIGSAKLALVSVGTTGNRYLGLEASGLAADLVGFESILQIGISGGSIAVNRVTTAAGAPAPTAPKLDWHALGADTDAAAVGVPVFSAGLTANTTLHAGGSASFNIASGVFVGKGTVTLDQATISSTAGGVTFVNADLFALSAERRRLLRGHRRHADAGDRPGCG